MRLEIILFLIGVCLLIFFKSGAKIPTEGLEKLKQSFKWKYVFVLLVVVLCLWGGYWYVNKPNEPKPDNTVKILVVSRTTLGDGKFLPKEQWVKIIPGHKIIAETVPEGQNSEFVIRDIKGKRISGFCLTNGTGMTKPDKPIPAEGTFFIDVRSEGNPVKVVFKFLPPY